jgi:hypothetical protein
VRSGRRPATDFFLRAESLFTAATYLEGLDSDPLAPMAAFLGAGERFVDRLFSD